MNILIIDDHTLFRQGLSLLVSELNSNIQFTEVASCREAFELEGDVAVSLVLLDLNLPGEQALELLPALKDKFRAPVVMLSSEDDSAIVKLSIESGASGFVPKSSTPQVLIAALQLILAGGTYLPPNVLDFANTMTQQSSNSSQGPADLINSLDMSAREKLSDRQLQVLLGAVQGKANKVIARELALSEGTVKAHMSSAYRALGVRNRTEAVYMAAKIGLTQIH